MHAETYFIIKILIFDFSFWEVEANMIDNFRSTIHWRISSTGPNPAVAQPDNSQGTCDKDFLNYILENLIEQPENTFDCRSSFVAATEASMQFWAVLPMGGAAIPCSSLPIPCSDSNSNSNKITNITNINHIKNIEVVNGSMIVEGAMSLGGEEWCQ